MARIISRARQARLNHQQKAGRLVTMQEVAEATGIARATINQIELNQTKGIDFDTLLKLCQFYGIQVGELLEVSEKDYTPDLAELDLLPA